VNNDGNPLYFSFFSKICKPFPICYSDITLKDIHHNHEYYSKTKGSILVTVFGATGKQGGSVICALAQDEKYRLRGVSKSADNKFKDLKDHGVEMMVANIATGEGLDEAFKGAHAAFLVTPSFDKDVEGKEYESGVKLIEKAKEHGVKIIVFSTAVHAQAISNQKYNVPQFDAKARLTEYLRNLQQKEKPFEHVIYVAPGFYYQNFYWKAFAPKKEGDTYVFRLPETKILTAFDVHDIGPIVKIALERPHEFSNKTIFLAAEEAPPEEFIKTFEKVTGKKARLEKISLSELKNNPNIHHTEQIYQMFQFMNEYTYFGKDREHFIHAKDIYPNLTTWEAYLKQNPFETP